jgi:hypothetical protein
MASICGILLFCIATFARSVRFVRSRVSFQRINRTSFIFIQHRVELLSISEVINFPMVPFNSSLDCSFPFYNSVCRINSVRYSGVSATAHCQCVVKGMQLCFSALCNASCLMCRFELYISSGSAWVIHRRRDWALTRFVLYAFLSTASMNQSAPSRLHPWRNE